MILANGGGGLPIGYYTSQWFSNLYLEGLDHYIKEKLQIPYYIRYVDDIVLLHSNKELLHAAIPKINLKLSEYRLSMKPNFQVWEKDSRPIDFVGYRFYSYTTKLRRKIYYHLHRQMRKLPNYSIHNLRSFSSISGYVKHLHVKTKFTDLVAQVNKEYRVNYLISVYDGGDG